MEKPKPDLVYDVHEVIKYLTEVHKLPKDFLMGYIQDRFDCPSQNTTVTISDEDFEEFDENFSPERRYLEILLEEFGTVNSYGTKEVRIEYWW